MVALARVTTDLAEARGPDVACSIEVPVAWFEAGATLQIQLPRLIQCARCEGGGCDACSRRGAFEQQAAGIASEVAIVLPKQAAEGCTSVKLRLPALGARAPEPRVPEPRVQEPRVAVEAGAGEAGAGEVAGELAVSALAASVAATGDAGESEGQTETEAPTEVEVQPTLPPGHLLLTIIPHAADPTWVPPANVQALVLVVPPSSFWGPVWERLRPLELLFFPDRLAAALRIWWQTRAPAGARPIWIWAALAVLVTVVGFWLLTRSGSRSQ
ncbi:MAG: hypothetical protein RL033_12 [Pseudomonadota bacterium]